MIVQLVETALDGQDEYLNAIKWGFHTLNLRDGRIGKLAGWLAFWPTSSLAHQLHANAGTLVLSRKRCGTTGGGHKHVPDYSAVFFMRLLFFALHVLLPSPQSCAQLSAIKSGLAEQIKMNPDECN